MKTQIFLPIVGLWFFLTSAYAQSLYPHKYTELQIKDYDQMSEMVDEKIAQSKALAIQYQNEGQDEVGDQEAVAQLREALKLIFSRPNKDNMVGKLVANVRRELGNYNAFESTMNSVASEALTAVQNETLSVLDRATAVYVLENIMSEVRPSLPKNEDFRNLVKQVRDADLEVPEKVKAHRKLTSMDETPDLSKVAKLLLEHAEKEIQKKEAEKKKESQAETK